MITVGTNLFKRGSKTAGGPIGVDLGSRCVKIFQLQRSRAGATSTVARIGRLPTRTGSDKGASTGSAAHLIRELLSSGGFVGRRAVGCLPDGVLEYRNMRLAPAMSEEQLNTTVQAEFGDYLDLPEGYLETRLFDTGDVWEEEERRTEIIAMAAPAKSVYEYLKLLKRCGLEPLAIDTRPTALLRSVTATSSKLPEGTSQILLDVGYEWTTVTIAHEQRIRFVRRLRSALGAVDDHVAKQLSVSREEAERLRENPADDSSPTSSAPGKRSVPGGRGESITAQLGDQAIRTAARKQGEELAREISKFIQYHAVTYREGRPRHGFVFGGGAGLQTLVEAVETETGVEFRHAETSDARWAELACSTSETAPPGIWAVAAGLAMYDESNLEDRVAV